MPSFYNFKNNSNQYSERRVAGLSVKFLYRLNARNITSVLVILNIILLAVTTGYTSSAATFIIQLLFLLLGLLFVKLLFSENVLPAYNLFLFFFFIYGSYMVITNILYVTDPAHDFFYAHDSLTYYNYIDGVSANRSVADIFHYYRNDFFSSDWKGFAIFSSLLSVFANAIDSNNIIIQKLQIVLFSVLILVILFRLLLKYYNVTRAYKLTLAYGLLSYSFFFSAVYLRDVHVGFLFALYFYLILMRRDWKGIIYGGLLCVLIFLFRPEHGYFSVSLLLLYLYLFILNGENKYRKALKFFLVGLILLFVLFFVFDVQHGLQTIQRANEVYYNNSLQKAGESSLGAELLKLPFGLRQIAAGLFSQIIPFPFYTVMGENPLYFPWAYAALFWFVVWVIIFYGLFSKGVNRILKRREIKLLFVIAIILILGASTNADTRRIMAVYPIIYIVFSGYYFSITEERRGRVVLNSLLSYLVLILFYIAIKGF